MESVKLKLISPNGGINFHLGMVVSYSKYSCDFKPAKGTPHLDTPDDI